MTFKRAALIVAVAVLTGCGKTTDLEPAPSQHLPIKPLMARTTPTPKELLTPPAYAAPERVDELMKKSQPRESDEFDLPPPSGGAAPALPVGSDPVPTTNQIDPAAPR
jgi:hypothetical protein